MSKGSKSKDRSKKTTVSPPADDSQGSVHPAPAVAAELSGFVDWVLRLDRRQFQWGMAVVLCLCFAVRLYRVSVPETMMFDEVYWGYTAQEIVNHNPVIYDPYAKPPPGLAYEWTHPPLGKLIIALGVEAFGPGTFGLRISSVIFGTISVLLAALISLELFSSYAAALLTAYFLTIETSGFALSRISMVDEHVLCFLLAAFLEYLAWRKRPERVAHLLGAGLGLGLATSTKWNSAFLFLVLGFDAMLLWGRSKLPDRNWVVWFLVAFGIVPPALYLLSYGHFFALGNSLEQFRLLQQQMWIYHSHLKATHTSASETWQWILNLKPVWFHTSIAPDGSSVEVFAIGNHVLLYTGLWAFLWCCKDLFKRTDELLALACFTYLTLWFPWTFSPRLKFFYHYLPAISLLMILCGYVLVLRLERWAASDRIRSRPRAIENCLLFGTLWAATLYPFIAAVPVSPSLDRFFRSTAGVFIF